MKRNLLIACVVGYVLCSAILWHSEHRSRVAYERIIRVQREVLREMTDLAGKRAADYWSCEAELATWKGTPHVLPDVPGTESVIWR